VPLVSKELLWNNCIQICRGTGYPRFAWWWSVYLLYVDSFVFMLGRCMHLVCDFVHFLYFLSSLLPDEAKTSPVCIWMGVGCGFRAQHLVET